MSRSHISIAEEVALTERAAELDIPISGLNLDSKESVSSTKSVLTEVAAAQVSTLDFVSQVKDVSKSAGKAISRLAKASGSEFAQKYSSQYEEHISGVASQLAGSVMDSMIGSGKLGKDPEKIASPICKIMDQGLEMIGYPSNPDDPESEEMRKIMMMIMALIAMMFLGGMGISPEMISMAGIALNTVSNSKSSSPIEMAKELATNILSDSSVREMLTDKAMKTLIEKNPELENLGLIEKAHEMQSVIAEQGVATLFKHARAFFESLKSDLTPEKIGNKFEKGLETVIEKSLEEHPELKDKFKLLLHQVFEKNTGGLLSSITDFAKSASESRNLGDKAKNLLSSVSSMSEFIDKFKETVLAEGKLTQTEKVVAEKVFKEMKSYCFERYAKPVKDCCDAAQKVGIDSILERIGFPKTVFKDLSSVLSKLQPQEQQVSR